MCGRRRVRSESALAQLLSLQTMAPFDAFCSTQGERPRLRDPFSGSVPPQIKYFRDVPSWVEINQ